MIGVLYMTFTFGLATTSTIALTHTFTLAHGCLHSCVHMHHFSNLCPCTHLQTCVHLQSYICLHPCAYSHPLWPFCKKCCQISKIPKQECVSGYSEQLWFFTPAPHARLPPFTPEPPNETFITNFWYIELTVSNLYCSTFHDGVVALTRSIQLFKFKLYASMLN